MVFEPLLETWNWISSLLPRRIKFQKPQFNFILIHYLYLLSMTIIASIMIFPAGGIKYIDALLFASGAATQSGLNPIDVKELFLYQQLIIYFIACVCNPIWINTFVVFVRLYWFEKRFQGVAREARLMRRERTRSRTRSQAKADLEQDREERGVLGRPIQVIRQPNGPTERREKQSISVSRDTEQSSNDNDQLEESPTFRRDIMFADEVGSQEKSKRRSSEVSNSERMPVRHPTETHIAFVENQKNPKEKGTLRIPGPRDYDRGDVPHLVDEGDDLVQQPSRDDATTTRHSQEPVERVDLAPTNNGTEEKHEELNADDHPTKISFAPEKEKRKEEKQKESTWRAGWAAFGSPFNFSRSIKSFKKEAPNLRKRITRSRTLATVRSWRSHEVDEDPVPYLSWNPTIGRNSTFVDMDEDQREELGGIEYRSLKTLAFILVLYFVGWHTIGMLCFVPWIIRADGYHDVLREDSINQVWWGWFTSATMFNDLGFTLTPESMIPFQRASFPLLIGTFLILIGNTAFPCMLRLIIWISEKFLRRNKSPLWEEFRFLLDHPRRCFTLLFPSDATWWLFWVLVLLNGIDLIFFVILDINDPAVESIPGWYRFVNGLFQAASTRTAGTSSVALNELHPAIQVSYLIMMYISVFPIAISLRRTNVYEEKSLGMFGGEAEDDNGNVQRQSYVGSHLRRQLSFDLWYIFLGFFIIAIVEGGRLENTNDYSFTLFSVLFEIISACGTVGLSLGYPGFNSSFCGQFQVISKLIIVAMQLRGRHRGLPYALDRAILLPSESLHKKEEEDALMRMRSRRGSRSTLRPFPGRDPSPNIATTTANDNDIAVTDGAFNPLARGRTRTSSSLRDDGNNVDVGSPVSRRSGWSGGGGGNRPRRNSRASTILEGEEDNEGRRREGGGGLSRLISGALSAGPSAQKDWSRKESDHRD